MNVWLTATLLASALFAPMAIAQTFFYAEIIKDSPHLRVRGMGEL